MGSLSRIPVNNISANFIVKPVLVQESGSSSRMLSLYITTL